MLAFTSNVSLKSNSKRSRSWSIDNEIVRAHAVLEPAHCRRSNLILSSYPRSRLL